MNIVLYKFYNAVFFKSKSLKKIMYYENESMKI